MTEKQKEIFDIFADKTRRMLDRIAERNIPKEWEEIFTIMYLNRGFRSVNDTTLSQMLNIAKTNSEAVKYLATQDKKAGLSMLEDLSIEIKEEKGRLQAVITILKKGIKASRKELQSIIAAAQASRGLFDRV